MTTPAEQTAADLRNAALSVTFAGYARGVSLDTLTGRVCASGALQLAVGMSRLDTEMRSYLETRPTYILRAITPYSAANPLALDRFEERIFAAARAMFDLLPPACDDCTNAWDITEPEMARLIHFNDHVCSGGEELVTLLLTAAEKIEANL